MLLHALGYRDKNKHGADSPNLSNKTVLWGQVSSDVGYRNTIVYTYTFFSFII
ncbi:hypothetical protein M104_1121 [Bacteroides fragilis str. 1007-1-F |uniref:Uncharacterized protein n=1 Tax=Bacteroides fragilis str. 1007-1-F \|nr:hypothetical protein M147_5000 [Bacteroides fragilis str. 1007-1-F \